MVLNNLFYITAKVSTVFEIGSRDWSRDLYATGDTIFTKFDGSSWNGLAVFARSDERTLHDTACKQIQIN